MMHKCQKIFAGAIPFLLVVVLWRLGVPQWNPGGILAMIPIFYYSFIHPTPWFAPYAVLFCFLIDYKSDTVLYWMALYCGLYAANGFQNYIDLTRWDRGGLRAFSLFFSIAMFILFFAHPTMANLMRMAWITVWTCLLYMPIIALGRGRK